MFSLTCALPRRTRTTAPGLPATGTSTACWMASAAAWAAIRFRVRSLIARAPRPPAGGGRNTSRRGRPAAAVAPGVASSVAELTGLELLRPESPGSKAPRSAGASGAPAVTVAPWSTDVAGRSARFRRPMPYRPTSPVRPATPPAETPQTRRTTRRSPTPSPSSVLWRPCSPSPLPTDGPRTTVGPGTTLLPVRGRAASHPATAPHSTRDSTVSSASSSGKWTSFTTMLTSTTSSPVIRSTATITFSRTSWATSGIGTP